MATQVRSLYPERKSSGPRFARRSVQQQRTTMHCQAELRLSPPGQVRAARRRYKTFMIDEILSKETCDYFEKLSLYSGCPSLLVRPRALHSCPGESPLGVRRVSLVTCGPPVCTPPLTT
ncbi:homeobox protein BarH-like 2 [Arapaima gigas]